MNLLSGGCPMRALSQKAWLKDLAALASLVSFIWIMGVWLDLVRSLSV